MKKYFSFLTILIFGVSCNGQAKKDLPEEKVSESKMISADHQKFIKTQSLNKGDNVHCSLQDKAGNLWFGTTGDGVYKYDGKSFTCFKDGLINPGVWSILEDNSGNFWVGTRETGLYLYDGKSFTKFSE